MGVEFVEKRLVILHVDDDVDEPMVLGRGADHGRAADVDILDHRVIVGTRSDGRLDAAVDFRMQGLHPAVHHLGKARQLGDVPHLEACIAHRLRGPARRDQFDPARRQRPGQIDKTGLVGDGKKGASNGMKIGHVWS